MGGWVLVLMEGTLDCGCLWFTWEVWCHMGLGNRGSGSLRGHTQQVFYALGFARDHCCYLATSLVAGGLGIQRSANANPP